jgi:hypothetical protein
VPFSSPICEEDIVDDESSKVLLWKICCLEAYKNWMKSTLNSDEDEGITNQEGKCLFYPFSMLKDSGSLTIEAHQTSRSRTSGLLYSQFYSSIKEVFTAGNTYPFTNPAIEGLSLDYRLRKTWQNVGAGLSHNPIALMKAYLYTKLRCHYAIIGSKHKSFGT